MEVALAVILLLAGVVVGWYDTFSVQRTYADVYAERHGRIPPLIGWFFEPDADAEVEGWRGHHRNMYLLVAALGTAAIVLLVVRAPTSG